MSRNIDQNQLDVSFGRFLASRADEHAGLLFRAGCVVSQARREGNVCVLLTSVDSSLTKAELKSALLGTGLVGEKDDYFPLILHGDYLYLHRYFKYETIVADFILNAVAQVVQPVGASSLLDQLFPDSASDGDEQKQAAIASLHHSFTVISGGPGTGKTTTVAKILALHLALQPTLRIMLAAPTGKAATRLEESLHATCGAFDFDESVKGAILQPVQTIHRLLGFTPRGFQYNKEQPLPADLVLVDEASMVDLPLMADLMGALSPTCRLILLGDQYQLASVQPGAVLGEICASDKNDETDGSNCIVTLKKNYRFKEESGIRLLAEFIKKGDGQSALRVLQDDAYPDVVLSPVDYSQIIMAVKKAYQGSTPEKMLTGFTKIGVLCCHRTGTLGVEDVNLQVSQSLQQAGKEYYHGLPLMILTNDHALGVYNGDTCVVVEKNKRFYGCFHGADGVRMILVRKLPAHAPAYGITVHKSQGSEYEDVAFLLPAGTSKVLGRELVYTAVTRARKHVAVYGEPEQFVEAVARKVVRVSGLAARL